MSLLMNLLWILLGGVFVFFGYMAGGIALCLTLIGIPWGIQCFKLAIFSLFPFGSDTRERREDSGSSLNLVMNVIWLVFGGIWNVFCHLGFGLLCCLSIIGIPFGLQHFKMMRLAFTPFGREIVDLD
ncbi:MAG: YccF domain-containing protein [Gammaproteobacteria bacterium]|nr:YccF domain-containing protein [Gammaproteobacteria bacterium]